MKSSNAGQRYSFLISILVLSFALLPTMFGCNRDSTVAGKYQSDKKPQESTELKSDGACIIRQGNTSYTGKYTLEGKALTLKLTTGDVVTGSIDGNTITDNQGEHWTKK